ncbi:MAG: hypothetical protein KGI37_01980 [Alphaproteobacteria bacterium]|nr:hypothetical protein [Alphaproteobacteria bacterium]
MAMCVALGVPAGAVAEPAPADSGDQSQHIEITADKSLEWYQDKNLYVARGNAKAVRGAATVTADILTAHQRDSAKGKNTGTKSAGTGAKSDMGDIDRMTADGNVVITRPNVRITGDHAVDDVDRHVTTITGNNLRYETPTQVVTARDSLEYWDDKKIAVARGDAVAVKGDRRVEGDVLTAEFRTQPNGQDQLYRMTADGHVTVITKNDVTRGDKAVYNAASDTAIVTGHVRITRADGTELTGDVAESNFNTNQSRLLNDGSGRVRALLPVKSSPGSKNGDKNGKTP